MARYIPDKQHIPQELIERDQWVTWRYEDEDGNPTDEPEGNKVPYNARTGGKASSTNPATWTSYDAAVRAAQRRKHHGVGYVFSKDDPFAGTDLDDCLEDGKLAPWATGIVKLLDSYTEISPSGRGVKIFVKGDIPQSVKTESIELYKQGRYFTITGNRWPDAPTDIRAVNGELDTVYEHARCIQREEKERTKNLTRDTQQQTIDTSNRYRKYCQEALEGERQKMMAAGDKGRHNRRYASAFALGGLLWTDAITKDEIFDALAVNFGKDQRLAEQTILDGIRDGELAPRDIQDRPIDSRALVSTEPARMQAPRDASSGDAPALPPVSAREKLPTAPLSVVRSALHEEEWGDAQLLQHLYNGRLVYDHGDKAWYACGGHAWQQDRTAMIRQLVAGQLAAQYLHAAAELTRMAEAVKGDEESETERDKESHEKAAKLQKDAKRMIERALNLRKVSRTQNILKYAESLLGMSGDEWDADPWLLGVVNGVIELRTATFRPGRPVDYIRTPAPTVWRGLDEPAPRWMRFLEEIFDGNPNKREIIDFLHRLLGYGITGLSTLAVLLILWGEEGRNGKDTLLRALKNALGDMAGAVGNDVVIETKGSRTAGAAQPHLADLQGKRIVWASETKEGTRLNEEQVKLVTGGGEIATRKLYSNMVRFKPTHLLLLLTNYRPHAPADDSALWSRIKLIPFNLRFVENPTAPNERKADPTLDCSLAAEASGILALLVRGCLAWQASGEQLLAPPCVAAATADYRHEEDELGRFINECCVVQPHAQARANALYEVYKSWTSDSNLKPLNGTAFGRRMGKRFEKKTDRNGTYYVGVGLSVRGGGGGFDDEA